MYPIEKQTEAARACGSASGAGCYLAWGWLGLVLGLIACARGVPALRSPEGGVECRSDLGGANICRNSVRVINEVRSTLPDLGGFRRAREGENVTEVYST